MAADTEVGRPTELDNELLLKIRQSILRGQEAIDIIVNLGINPKTWEGWVYRDYQGFAGKLADYKRERMVAQAEKGLAEILSMNPRDAQELKVKQDTLKFITERLNKPKYAAKQEVDHTSQGEAIKGFNYIVPKEDDPNAPANS